VEIENITFEWNITSTGPDVIKLQLTFADPAQVSNDLMNPDLARLTFCDLLFFQSATGSTLDNAAIHKALPPQISAKALKQVEMLQTATLTLTTVLIQNLVANLLIGGSLSLLWGLISSIQVIMHTFLFNVALPQNAQLFCSKFMFIASFNLIPTDPIFDKLFALRDTEPPSTSYVELGYGSLSLFHNLGTLFFLLTAHLIGVMIYCILCICCDSENLPKWIKEHLFKGAFIRFFMESYLQIAISVALSFTWPMALSWQDKFQQSFTIILCLMLIAVPVFHFAYLACHRELLVDRYFLT